MAKGSFLSIFFENALIKRNYLIFFLTIIVIFFLIFYQLVPSYLRELFNAILILVPFTLSIGSIALKYLETKEDPIDDPETQNDDQSNKAVMSANEETTTTTTTTTTRPQSDTEDKVRRREINQLYMQLLSSRSRIRGEISRLIKNGNLNLMIALFLTTLAIIILTIYAYTSKYENYELMLVSFVPKLSIAVFIELFAFFFLRMYKSTLDEIKYFQNEITNVEQKIVAVKICLNKSQKDISYVIKELLKVERNFKLAKGESTVEIEKTKIDFVTKSEMLGFSNKFPREKKIKEKYQQATSRQPSNAGG